MIRRVEEVKKVILEILLWGLKRERLIRKVKRDRKKNIGWGKGGEKGGKGEKKVKSDT